MLWAHPASSDTAAQAATPTWTVKIPGGPALLEELASTLHADLQLGMLVALGRIPRLLLQSSTSLLSPQSSFCAHHMLAFLDTHTYSTMV